MAKKRKKRSKIEIELDTIDNSVDGILSQYGSLTPKEKKSKTKELEKELKILQKKYKKEGIITDSFKIKAIERNIDKLKSKEDKLRINYGGVQLNVKPSYLKKVEKKEQYLDGLFSRRLEKYLREYPVPRNIAEAKELEGLISKYSKKLKFSKFYDPNIVENNINKLTNFESKLTLYKKSEYIQNKQDVIYDEIEDYESGRDIEDYFEELTGVEEENYKAVEKPILLEGLLIGIDFNFF